MVEVVAALIRQDDHFLICQRPAGKKRALLWEFPGGKVEPGENPLQALIRECREELSVNLRVGDLYAQTEHQYDDIHIRLSLYEARIASGSLTRNEHHDMRWIQPQDIKDFSFCPADAAIIERLSDEN
jgi:8-oxo-dGTP diphosphatase